MKKPVDNPVLKTWIGLNDFLMSASEESCEKLLQEELKGRKRRQFMLRIHSRLNKLRAIRERKELKGKAV